MIDDKPIQVILNDKPFDCNIGATVSEVIAKVADIKGVAVALNGQILPKDDWARVVQSGDSILVFGVIAGG